MSQGHFHFFSVKSKGSDKRNENWNPESKPVHENIHNLNLVLAYGYWKAWCWLIQLLFVLEFMPLNSCYNTYLVLYLYFSCICVLGFYRNNMIMRWRNSRLNQSIMNYCGSFYTSIFTWSQHVSLTIVHLLVLVLIPISTSLAFSINLTASMLTPGSTSGPVVTSSGSKSKWLQINCED